MDAQEMVQKLRREQTERIYIRRKEGILEAANDLEFSAETIAHHVRDLLEQNESAIQEINRLALANKELAERITDLEIELQEWRSGKDAE